MGREAGGVYILRVWARWSGVKPGRMGTVIWLGEGREEGLLTALLFGLRLANRTKGARIGRVLNWEVGMRRSRTVRKVRRDGRRGSEEVAIVEVGP